METFFEKDYVRISYNAENHYMLHEWLIPPTADEFKEGCEQLLSAVKHYKTIKAVVDTRGQGVVAPELLEWMTTDWISEMISSGHRYAAIILPSEIFTQLSVEEIMDDISDKIVSKNFDSMGDAKKWVETLPRTRTDEQKG